MKKLTKISMSLVLAVMAIGFGSCDADHFWSDLSGGTWKAVYIHNNGRDYDLNTNDDDYVEFHFGTDGRGHMSYWKGNTWVTEYFIWDDDRRGEVRIEFENRDVVRYYFDYVRGHLYLSETADMYNYTAYVR